MANGTNNQNCQRGIAHLIYDFASNIALLQTSDILNIFLYLKYIQRNANYEISILKESLLSYPNH